MRPGRRAFHRLLLSCALVGFGLSGASCKKDEPRRDGRPEAAPAEGRVPNKKETRCAHCGMKIDPASSWRTDLTLADGSAVSFDTPRCAFTSWRSGKTPATGLRAQEYYDRSWKRAEELRFVVGGDVVGPMGPDLVPVDPSRVTKFIQDHGADRAYRLEEVTLPVLQAK